MEEKKTVDEIVGMLDRFMAEGGGHMNLHVDKDKSGISVDNGIDCAGNTACSAPTLHQGLDEEERKGE